MKKDIRDIDDTSFKHLEIWNAMVNSMEWIMTRQLNWYSKKLCFNWYHRIEDGRFFYILVYIDKNRSMRNECVYSEEDKANLKCTLQTLK